MLEVDQGKEELSAKQAPLPDLKHIYKCIKGGVVVVVGDELHFRASVSLSAEVHFLFWSAQCPSTTKSDFIWRDFQ